MADLNAIGNDSFRKAMAKIIKPTLAAGGGDSAVMVVLESTVAGVLLALYKNGKMAAAMMEEGLVPGVVDRLVKYDHDKAETGDDDE